MDLIRGVYSHSVWPPGYEKVYVDNREGFRPVNRQIYNSKSKIIVSDQFIIQCINEIIKVDPATSFEMLLDFVNRFGLIQEMDILLEKNPQYSGPHAWSEKKPNIMDKNYPVVLRRTIYTQSYAILNSIKFSELEDSESKLRENIEEALKHFVEYDAKLQIGKKTFLEARPLNLSGAIWLFIAETLLGGGSFHECKTCGEWFAVKDGRGTKAKTCSGACRTNRSRYNQQAP